MHVDNSVKFNRDLWRISGIFFLLQVVLFSFLYRSSILSAVHVWNITGAYNHCYLIVPIAIYLVHSNRQSLASVVPQPTIWGCVVTFGASCLWWACYQAGIAEGEHFAVIGVIEGMLLTSFGGVVFRRLLIPFLYLFLMVPTGEILLPVLQRITAVASGTLLELSGVPTFRDGLFIEVPTGSYVVAPGCAGLNFLLASLALSVAYVDLVYRDWGRRLAFIAAMLGLALIGNTLRVFLIILIAHLTNNVGDIVDDHVLYGWGFFSLLIFAAMAIGHRYRQDLPDTAPGVSAPPAVGRGRAPLWRLALPAVAAFAALPVLASVAGGLPAGAPLAAPRLSCGPFEQVKGNTAWLTGRQRVDALSSIDCAAGATRLHLAVGLLRRPLRESKLYRLEHWMVGNETWELVGRSVRQLDRPEGPVWVLAETFHSEDEQHTVWSVRWVGGHAVRPGLDTLLADFRAEVGGSRRAALLVVEADGPPVAVTPDIERLLTSLPLSKRDLGVEF